MKRRSSVVTLLGTFLVAGMLALGGCAGGNVAGPQPDAPTTQTVENEDPGSVGGAATNDSDGTGGTAGHNVSTED